MISLPFRSLKLKSKLSDTDFGMRLIYKIIQIHLNFI